MKVNNPFNLKIMHLTQDRLARVPRITTPETYDGMKGELHPQGLFSLVLFGDIGTHQRDYTFGHIKLNTKLIHPYVCKWLKQLKGLHEDIWMGKMYATFNENLGEFEQSDPINGQTGYAFFLSCLDKLKPKKNKSPRRNTIVDNLIKYKDSILMEYHLVLPAGLRDIMTDSTGKVTEDEVNEYYRKLIRLSNSLENTPKNQGAELDNIRTTMQITVNIIYDYFSNIMQGKKGFLQGKWGHRTIQDGTRNVISSMDTSATVLGSPSAPTIDTGMVGMFQILKGARPICIHLLRQFRLHQLSFPESNSENAYLVNPTTLKRVPIKLDDYDINRWTSVDGIEKLFSLFEKTSFRAYHCRIKGHYLGLVYQDDKKYQVLADIDELPIGWDKNNVRPITYIELFYLMGYQRYNTLKIQATRYPVTGEESVRISDLYCKTTMKGLQLKEYENGEATGNIAYEYPSLKDGTFFDSYSPSSATIRTQGGIVKINH